MFELPFKKRLLQFFCGHNYFAVATTDNFQEPGNHDKRDEAIFYRCENCHHVQINQKQ